MKRRLLSLVLSLAMVLSIGTVTAFAAGTTLTINAPETLPKAGETFTVTVDLSGNPGFSALQFTLAFDGAAMDCTKVRNGAVMKGTLSVTNPDAEAGAIVAGATVEPVTENGQVATFTFTAKEDITDFDFHLVDVTLSDENADPIGYSVAFTGGTSSGDSGSSGDAEDEETEDGEEETEEESTPVIIKPESFTDTKGHWAESFINEAVSYGLFSGYPDGSFRPGANVTRAQFVTVLWRMAGKPAVNAATPFTDIANLREEFRQAIVWAYTMGYVGGVTETTFVPNGSLTRAAAMKILYFYNGGVSGGELMMTGIYDAGFVDSGALSSWAKAPMYWGVYNGIISGNSASQLNPRGTATRAHLAKILVNYLDKFETEAIA